MSYEIQPPDDGIPGWVKAGAFKGRLENSKWKWVIIIGMLIFFSAMTLFPIAAYQEESSNRIALDEQGINTEGTVSRKWTETSRSANSSTRTTEYYISYSFDGDSGRGVDIIFAEQKVSSGFYDSVSNGQSVPVTFLTNNPDVNRVEALNDEGFILIAVALFGLLSLFAIYLAAANWQMARYKAQMKQGDVIQAV